MSTIVDLTRLGTRGIIICGGRKGDLAGSSVSYAGDINGDGYADVIVGAPRANPQRELTGKAYVLFGGPNATGPIDLGHLGAASGFTIVGQAALLKTGLAGTTVSSAGDFNHDGYDDFLVGAPDNNAGAGAAYLVYGKATGVSTLSLDRLAPADGFKISGGLGDHAATGLAAAGDVNGDGFADVIVGSPQDSGGGFWSGGAYVIFGSPTPYTGIDLDTLSPDKGFAIRGDTFGDKAGTSVASAGDVNGDGLADLIVGAPSSNDGGTFAGEAYVVFGRRDGYGPAGLVDLTDLSPAMGFVIQGDAAFDAAGTSVSTAGDINADGYADLIVGAPDGDDGGTGAGEAYVIFGKAGGFGRIDLAGLAPSDGFVIQGDEAFDLAGGSVSAAGDVNGDGFADVIVGARRGDLAGTSGGQAYVIYGKAAGFGTIDLTNLSAGDGFVIQGDTKGDNAGFSVSGAGDVNGDGFADVIVGAPYGDDLGKDAGNAYIIFGAAPTKDVKRVGTDIANTIHGGSGADSLDGRGGDDVLIGGDGNDALTGAEGNDVLEGGNGADKLSGSVGDDVLFGGAGADTLGGGVGSDVLDGGDGQDTLTGGEGQDTLTGGLDADRFHFSFGGTAADPALADRITDFNQASGDVIDLADFDAVAGTPRIDRFAFVGDAAFSGAAGELRYEFSGGDTLLSGDTNGDTVADFTIRLTGTVALTDADLLLAAAATPVRGGHAFAFLADIHANHLIQLA